MNVTAASFFFLNLFFIDDRTLHGLMDNAYFFVYIFFII